MEKHILGMSALAAICVAAVVSMVICEQLEQKSREGYAYDVDFDQSLQTALYPQRLKDPVEQHFYNTFKTLYNRNRLAELSQKAQVTIPKIIHQIWLGSPFPEKYRAFQASWKQFHPEWEYRLWDDAALAQFPLKNRDLYEAAVNYGEKSDIARYEILYELGGLYVDTDFECLRPFDIFHHTYDFYVGIQPLDTNLMQLGIGLIGSAPGNPIVKCAIENLARNAAHTKQIIQKTGPIYFTRVFDLVAPQLSNRIIALPPTYFYPKGYTQKDQPESVWRKPESFAVHHWEGSWLKKEAFVPQFAVTPEI